jgi:hypothetical protein
LAKGAFRQTRAGELRVRYKYRELVLRGLVRAPRKALRPLVGPDCAYHLYRLRR